MRQFIDFTTHTHTHSHYPTTRFTSVADTPENKRLAQQSKQQSDLEYRKDREGYMKEFTQVSDNVSTRQAQQQQRLASNIGYQSAPSQPARVEPSRPTPQCKFITICSLNVLLKVLIAMLVITTNSQLIKQMSQKLIHSNFHC